MVGTTSASDESKGHSAICSQSVHDEVPTAKHSHHSCQCNHKGHNQDMEALAPNSSTSASVPGTPSRETSPSGAASGNDDFGGENHAKGGGFSGQQGPDTNNDSKNGDGSGGGKSDGSPPSTMGKGQGFLAPHCHHNDASAGQFTGNWTANVVGTSGLRRTSRTSTTPGTRASFQFSGNKIVILGQIHKSIGHDSPSAVYTIDSANSIELPLPVSNMDIPVLSFFTSPELPSGNHTLDINITAVNPDTPYTILGFATCNSNFGNAMASAADNSFGSVHNKAQSLGPGAVAGIVIGCVAFVLFIVLGCFLFHRRQRSIRSARTADSPITRWLERRMSGSLFTSSTSIMRNTPSDHSAVAVPPFDQVSTLEKSDQGYYPRTPTEVSSRPTTPRFARSTHRPVGKPARHASTWTVPSLSRSDRSFAADEVAPPLPAKLHPT